MVIDNIRNANLYYGLGARIEKALRFLQETDFLEKEPGKYEIDGTNVYALLQEYQTKLQTEGKWEAHRKYMDVQFVVSGKEQMGYANINCLNVISEYDADGDYLLLDGYGSMNICNPGTFAIFGPEDAHMPCIAIDGPKPVRKVVVKVQV